MDSTEPKTQQTLPEPQAGDGEQQLKQRNPPADSSNDVGHENGIENENENEKGNETENENDNESELSCSDNEEDASDACDSDIEDNYDDAITFPGQRLRRSSRPELPETVTVLETETGGKLYLLGTAHFSQQSQDDVRKVIQQTQPDIVVLELCHSRINILKLDEKTLLEEARNINFTKVREAIKQSGFVQGIMHVLLLNMSAHLTKQLGMAPGGEFRAAFDEASKLAGCRMILGDRPIQVTLKRAFASLSWCQRLKLGWHMMTSKEPISAEEVEKCKQKDLLEEMLREMTGEFPHISKVFVEERDLYLAHSLRQAVHPIPPLQHDGDWIPSVVVGVVGIGHVTGIAANWETVTSADVTEVMQIPPGSAAFTLFRWSFRAVLVGVLAWGCYGVFSKIQQFVTS